MHVNVYVDVCARVYYFQNLKVKLVVFSYFYSLTEEEEKKLSKFISIFSLSHSIYLYRRFRKTILRNERKN